MARIVELPQHVADMIAAGEVVERPGSVVKELMENSIDAGATVVTVEIQRGGMTYIRVTDNGCGMSPEDAATAFLRHATSKLRDERGLEAIGTLGFRGEALAAIAAVSRIELLTKRIFEMVKKRPDKEGQISKFMNYYLPTTLKLLDSYALLEAQGIEGDNISASKQQIEGIMDTLIQGFEKQLDLLFSAQAMDINSDIEVLESMMAADGLKDNEFRLKRTGSR